MLLNTMGTPSKIFLVRNVDQMPAELHRASHQIIFFKKAPKFGKSPALGLIDALP